LERISAAWSYLQIYTRNRGDKDQAIESAAQSRKIEHAPAIQRRLALLLKQRGKELNKDGTNDAGNALIDEAKSFSTNSPNSKIASGDNDKRGESATEDRAPVRTILLAPPEAKKQILSRRERSFFSQEQTNRHR